MKLPPLDVRSAESVEEASGLLEEMGEDTALYAGGTELLLLLKLGLADFRHLVDIKRIPELQVLRGADGYLEIGAGVTHRQLERSAIVRAGWPTFAQMEHHVANIRVRSVGSIGGNLCFADPHSDPATYLLAADAVLLCRGAKTAARSIGIRDLFVGPYETCLRPFELLTAIRLTALGPADAIAHQRLAFTERPAATVACFVHVEDGHVTQARIAVGSVGLTPVRAPQAERSLVGMSARLTASGALQEVAEAAAEAAAPVADRNGSVEYKRQLVKVLVTRCVRDATEAASHAA